MNPRIFQPFSDTEPAGVRLAERRDAERRVARGAPPVLLVHCAPGEDERRRERAARRPFPGCRFSGHMKSFHKSKHPR